jgi:hypothetical protein
LSAASGLVVLDGHYVVAADDAHHLGLFPCDSTGAGRALRVLSGDLPEDAVLRKRQKPDFEALTLVPPTSSFAHGALLAVGSGSTPNRELAVLIEIDSEGRLTDRMHERTLADLYAPLRERIGELNIEGAFVLDDELVVISRANGSSPDNHVAAFALSGLTAWFAGLSPGTLYPRSLTTMHVGEIDGVPLGVTDGAAHPEGGWVFCAAAEDTADSYNDGALVGAAVGVVSPQGDMAFLARIEPNHKVEGIVASVDAGVTTLTMVTDGDDPSAAAVLLVATLPA